MSNQREAARVRLPGSWFGRLMAVLVMLPPVLLISACWALLVPDSLAFLGVAICVVGLLRIAAVTVTVTPERIEIRNPVRTYRVPWSDIIEFREVQPWWTKGVPCPAARTSTRMVPMWALLYGETPIAGKPTRPAQEIAGAIESVAETHGIGVQRGWLLRRSARH